MAQGIDILHLFPELVTIDKQQLQAYCDEWLRRPIARQFDIAQFTVDENLMLQIKLAAQNSASPGDRACLPIVELLEFIIDRHFADPEKRLELHTAIRETRRRWSELGKDYKMTVGRRGTLYLTCKNPTCSAELETEHQATEDQEVFSPPTDVTCPVCGSTHKYDGYDLHLGANI
jgi:hypothetical protein